jgi:tetratricopeptide (TPR) repeat protein
MKASVSPVALLVALLIGSAASGLFAQDVVVQKDGQRREGQVVGVKGDAVRIKVGPVETGIPLANVASVVMQPPKAFNDALATWQKGDAPGTLKILKPFVETYNGLPAPWASRAAALLGEVYLANGSLPEAEAAFASFQKFYPDASSLADIGLARLAVAKKDYTGARTKLAPILDKAKKTLAPESEESAVFGQALLLMGEVQESAGENAEALENYLLAVTIFREDQAVVAKANERASALKEKNVVVP